MTKTQQRTILENIVSFSLYLPRGPHKEISSPVIQVFIRYFFIIGVVNDLTRMLDVSERTIRVSSRSTARIKRLE